MLETSSPVQKPLEDKAIHHSTPFLDLPDGEPHFFISRLTHLIFSLSDGAPHFFISHMEHVFPLQKKASFWLDAVVQQLSCVVRSVSTVMSDNQEVLGSEVSMCVCMCSPV